MNKIKMIWELQQALRENEIAMLAERRLSLQMDLMLARVEIMKSLIKVQGDLISDLCETEYKEAA